MHIIAPRISFLIQHCKIQMIVNLNDFTHHIRIE
jgi:hypothetical protein